MLHPHLRPPVSPSSALLACLLGLSIAAAGCGGGSPEPTPPGGAACQVEADCQGWLADQGLAGGCVRAACTFGQCRAAADPAVCDDQDPCTADSCDPASGACGHAVATGASCDDGAACTTTDRCGDDGACHGVPTAACGCGTAADCPVPVGVDLCSTAIVCTASHVCATEAREPVVCGAAADPCQLLTCRASTGECAAGPVPDGASCVPTDDVATEGTCVAGACQPLEGCKIGQPCCDDGDPCTRDIPDGSEGCLHLPDTGTLCDDGDACTLADVCVVGACQGKPVTCDDGNPCTEDACDGATGTCAHVPTSAACDDGDPCTTGDLCQGGSCNGTALACDDGNPCTSDACEAVAGEASCAHVAEDFGCDDGDPFTEPDLCHEGACVPGPRQPCTDSTDCDAIAGSDLCVGSWYCELESGTCVAVPESVVHCPPSETPCTNNACVPETGLCAQVPKEDGFPCDDGDACTEAGVCVDGGCVSQPIDCDDVDPCTADLCSAGECEYLDLVGGASLFAPDLSAGMPAGWTGTSTSAELGWRVLAGELLLTGPDGSYDHGAQRVEVRSSEFWLYGAEIAATFDYQFANADPQPSCLGDHLAVLVEHDGVRDQVACISEAAHDWRSVSVDLAAFANRRVRLVLAFVSNASDNAGFGARVASLAVTASYTCDPSQPCATGLCAAEGCKPHAIVCDDGDPCTADACDVFTGGCTSTPLAHCACDASSTCPGSGPCAVASCGPDGFCALEALEGACDDGNACTTGDACAAGECVGAVLDCDDGDPCTQDSCDPAVGCVHQFAAMACDDGDPCTVDDACVEGAGCQGTPKVCESWSTCAVGVCGPGGACSFDIKQDGQPEAKEGFDSVVPGALPAGWQVSSNDPALTWDARPTGAPSLPNALVLDATVAPHPDLSVAVESPVVSIPPAGGTLRFWLSAALPDASCDSDVVTVTIDGRIATLVCSSTDGFVQLSVDLGPEGLDLGGRDVTLEFHVLSLASEGPGPHVAIDGVEVLGAWPCDDGNACTAGDRCQLGLCKGAPVSACQ
ncbi:MAG: hypothetical protein H6744_16170 [Deltaproteobacteria bacterium]|nr:hypothetical protein [Deltaproteobacteria bacterium]MCB9788219.1 hypothetical protein [Deltaproteobacteria bacterium]